MASRPGGLVNWKCSDGIERDVFREVVTESIGNAVLASRIEEVTEEDIRNTPTGPDCKHDIVYDERGFYHAFRVCALCGKGRGTV